MYETSVVKLHTHYIEYDPLTPFEIKDNGISIGTAFFFDKDLLLTCYHCVHNAIKLFISLPQTSKKEYEVSIYSVIPEMDIAIIQLVDELNFQHQILELGNSENIESQDKVTAIGYPRNSDSLKYTQGIVSGKHNELIQTDASINPGNSGGPLVRDNKVVGINSSKLKDSEGVGFSIPINFYHQWKQYTKENKIIRLPWINIKYSPLGEDGIKFFKDKGYPYDSGIIVVESLETNIKSGDIIFSINGNIIDNFGYIQNKTNKINLKKYIKLLVYNNDVKIVGWSTQPFERTLKIPKENENCKIKNVYPILENYGYIVLGGIVLMQLTRNHLEDLIENDGIHPILKFNLLRYTMNDYESVIFVSSILSGSPVSSTDILQAGDIIVNVNGISIRTIKDIVEAIDNKDTLLLYTQRDKLFIYPIIKLREIDTMLKKKYKYN